MQRYRDLKIWVCGKNSIPLLKTVVNHACNSWNTTSPFSSAWKIYCFIYCCKNIYLYKIIYILLSIFSSKSRVVQLPRVRATGIQLLHAINLRENCTKSRKGGGGGGVIKNSLFLQCFNQIFSVFLLDQHLVFNTTFTICQDDKISMEIWRILTD